MSTSSELEQALTETAWHDPALVGDPAKALSSLGVDIPSGMRVELRVQRRDTLCLVIPPAFAAGDDGGDGDSVVNQMDLWRSGEQFIWIMPQEAKIALLRMREQHRRHAAGDGR